jgi:hypothetical protein
MDEFKFYCPSCSQKLSAPLDMAGSEIDCPICDNVITIPSPSAPPPVPAPTVVPDVPRHDEDSFSTTMRLDFQELHTPSAPQPPTLHPQPSPALAAPPPAPASLAPQTSARAGSSDMCSGCSNMLVVDALGTCVFCGLNYKSGIRIAGA